MNNNGIFMSNDGLTLLLLLFACPPFRPVSARFGAEPRKCRKAAGRQRDASVQAVSPRRSWGVVLAPQAWDDPMAGISTAATTE